MFDTIKKYCDIIAPSGYEYLLKQAILDDIKPYADSIECDTMGNVIAFKKGKKVPDHKTVVSAHMDEVGLMVKYITDEGRIYFSPLGGIDRRVLASKRVMIGDNHILGVIASKPIHLQTADEKGKCEDPSFMTIDIGASSRAEAEKVVSIGDYIGFVPNYEEFGDGFVRSKAIDDRFGCAVLTELIKGELKYDTHFAFVVSEECGCYGGQVVAKKLQPDAAIVVEATTAGDIAGAPDAKKACLLRSGAVISHMDNGTIYDPQVVQEVMNVAEQKGIKAQIKNIVAGGNDAKAYQTSGGACKVLAVSLPTRYIHSPACVAAFEDMTAVYQLVKAMLERGF